MEDEDICLVNLSSVPAVYRNKNSWRNYSKSLNLLPRERDVWNPSNISPGIFSSSLFSHFTCLWHLSIKPYSDSDLIIVKQTIDVWLNSTLFFTTVKTFPLKDPTITFCFFGYLFTTAPLLHLEWENYKHGLPLIPLQDCVRHIFNPTHYIPMLNLTYIFGHYYKARH